LQAEWKKIGPVRKSKSEAIWQRFRAACDRFFDRYKHRDQVELLEKAAVRETVIRDLEALVPQESSEPVSAPDNLYDTIHQARAKWQQAPELPRPVQQDLAARSAHDDAAPLGDRRQPAVARGRDATREQGFLRSTSGSPASRA
jgi:hypothetical protein